MKGFEDAVREASWFLRLCLVPLVLFSMFLSPIARGGGVTIITHGFASEADQGWVSRMADAVTSRVDGVAAIYVIRLTATNETGYTSCELVGVPTIDNANSGETVICLDWSTMDTTHWSTFAVGDLAFHALIEDFLAKHFLEQPIHLIGHSRGGSLISQLAGRLGQCRIWVDHVTTLDSRPLLADQGFGGMSVWENIVFADNYYQTLVVPLGESIPNAYDNHLSILSDGYFLPHSDVHLWYHGTIDLSPNAFDGTFQVPSAFYGSGSLARDQVGFKYSLIDKGIRPSAGLASWFNGSANRVTLDNYVDAQYQWPNIIIENCDGLWTINEDDCVRVKATYSAPAGGATVTYFVDDDRNPYTVGTGRDLSPSYSVPVSASLPSPDTRVDYCSLSFSDNGKYLGARISDGTHVRYCYLAKPMTVTRVPVALGSVSVSPSSGTPANTYTYSVHYKDSSGNGPQSPRLYLDGSTTGYSIMSNVSGTASDGTYTFNKSDWGTGAHNYYFSFIAHDGTVVRLPATSGIFSGPTVNSSGGGGGNVSLDTLWGAETYGGRYGDGGRVEPDYFVRYDSKYSAGAQVWFTAFPKFGWQVDHWYQRYIWNQTPGSAYYYDVDAVSGNSAMMVVREGDSLCHAMICRFKRINEGNRILAIATIGPGQVNPASGSYEHTLGSTVPLTATANGDGKFLRWEVGGTSVGTNLSYQVTLDSDRPVTAVFGYNQTAIYTNYLPCIEDGTVRIEDPGENVGQDELGALRLGHKNQYTNPREYTWESLLKFDVSRIPSDAVVTNMKLRLWCSSLPNYSGIGYEIQKNTGLWSESTITGLTTECNNRFVYNGDGLFNGNINEFHEIALSDRLTDSLNWIGLWKSANFGLRLAPSQFTVQLGDDYADGINSAYYYAFASRHNGDSNRWPVLIVTYVGRKLVPGVGVDSSNVVTQLIKGAGSTNIILSIRNVGEGVLSYNAVSATNWLTLSGTTNGTSTGEVRQVTVTLNESGLSQGTFLSSITVTDGNASNSTVTIPVTFTVSGPSIGVNPCSLSTDILQGNNPESFAFNLWNSGKGVLDYSISTSDTWLTLSTNSGSLSTGLLQRVEVQFNASGLTPGTYTNEITVTNTAEYALSVGKVTVVLSVCTQQVATPFFYPSANMLYLSDQPVSIFNATDGSTIRYTKDGTLPTDASTLFDGSPVGITNNTLMIARAWKTSLYRSEATVANYEVRPTRIVGSDRVYWDRVGLSWPTVSSATNYLVWRSTINDSGSASQIGTTTTTNFVDNSPGTSTNYYWIKAVISNQVSGFSFGDQGCVIPNPKPVILITSPTNNSIYTAPAGIMVSATATDDGSVTQVVFYANGVQIGAPDKVVPYSVIWSGVPTGTYALTACAWDNHSACATSAPVNITVALPEFSVTGIQLIPTVPCADGTFTALVTVANSGLIAGNAGTLYVYTNKPAEVTVGTTPTAQAAIGTLGAGSNKTITIPGLKAGAGGIRAFRAFVDALNVTPEVCETNNQLVLPYSVVGKPDLSVLSIAFDPAVPSTGAVFNAYVAIKNSGNGVASNFHVSVWTNMVGVPAGIAGENGGEDIALLGAGQVVTNVFSGLFAGNVSTARTFRAFVNSTRTETNEISESNNQLTKVYTPIKHADFWISDITLDPSQPLVGKTFTAYVTVTNTGAIAGSGGSLYVYTNKPAAVTAKTAGNGSVSVGTLAVGQGKRLKISNLKAGLEGVKTFRAFVDATAGTIEVSETNNQAVLSYAVVTKPDVQVTGVTLLPSTPSRGGVFAAKVTVKNVGSAPASNVYVSVWADRSATATNSLDTNKDGSAALGANIGTIATNASVVYTFTGLDAWTGKVARVCRVLADSDLSIGEILETNNQLALGYTPASRPDFIITDITLSTTNPPVGSNFVANVTVKNIGYVSGEAGYLDVWTDKGTNVVPNSNLKGDKYQSVGTLNTNATKMLTFTQLPAGTNAVSKVFRAVVDSRAAKNEVCETNNQEKVDYTVGGP